MSQAKPYPLAGNQDLELDAWCFNRTWKLLDKADRSQLEDDEMLMTVFACRYGRTLFDARSFRAWTAFDLGQEVWRCG